MVIWQIISGQDLNPPTGYNKGDDITNLLAEYTRENSRKDNYINILVNMYEAEIQKLKSSNFSRPILHLWPPLVFP